LTMKLVGAACSALALAAATLPEGALATTVSFSRFSRGFDDVRISTDRGTVEAGQFRGFLDRHSLLSFCVHGFHAPCIRRTYTDYSLVSGAEYFGSSRSGSDIARLATGYLEDVHDATTSAAFQLAVWEIVNEKGDKYDLRKGSFTASARDRGSRAAISL